MTRVWNFSAGPATLPLEVLENVQENLVDYHGQGLSVLEMSHRSDSFQEIIEGAEALIRELLAVPSNYQVLFMQGGATLQFSALPLNLLKKGKAAYLIGGSWGEKAYKEAKKLTGKATILASSKDDQYQKLPVLTDFNSSDYDYIHITSNNTIEGTQYRNYPDPKSSNLVADMSSDFLSHPVDVSQFALIYAGAQKNVGPAGVSVVIIRDDLLEDNGQVIPTYLDYKTHASKHSLYNTPPTFSIYVMRLVLEWIKNQGGLAAIDQINQRKAAKLYQAIDQSEIFVNPVDPADRSLMNIPFTSQDADIDQEFIQAAKEKGFINLKGHRSVGGMRASIYNAFSEAGVDALVQFMKAFESEVKHEKN